MDQLCRLSDIMTLWVPPFRPSPCCWDDDRPRTACRQYHGLFRLPSLSLRTAMIEEPCIIQMNIDRYRAMLRQRLGDEERARIEQLLAEANRQLAEAIRQLAR